MKTTIQNTRDNLVCLKTQGQDKPRILQEYLKSTPIDFFPHELKNYIIPEQYNDF